MIAQISKKIVYWSIVIIPFVASFSSAAVDSFIGLMVFAYIIQKIVTRDAKISNTPINIPFALIIGVSILSFMNSVNLQSSVQGIVKLLKYGFLIVIISGGIQDKKHLTRVIGAALFGLLLVSLDGAYQMAFGADLLRHNPSDTMIGLIRLNGTFPNTNIFAGYLALFVPLCVPIALYHLKEVRKIILEVITVLGLFCLTFTFSRSGAIGVWLAIFLMGLIKKDKAVIIMMVLVLVIAPFIMPANIRIWAKTTTSLSDLLLTNSRLVLNETSLNMIKSHPIVGVGVNTYCLNYQKYKLHDIDQETAGTMWYAHNSFLQMAGEIGITGLFIFLYLLFKIFSGWSAFYRKTKDSLLSLSSLGIVMGLFAFLIHGLTETNLYYPKIATLFWFQAGLLMAVLRLGRSIDSAN